MRARDQSSIFSTGGKFRPDYGLLLELHALTLVTCSYALLCMPSGNFTFAFVTSHGCHIKLSFKTYGIHTTDIYIYTCTHMKNPQFDSLVWGLVTLAPIIHLGMHLLYHHGAACMSLMTRSNVSAFHH